mmetsp:Transcript_46455/g.68666  ORF Transcript_46455/g.68666 Transcript_46455/m.68666 type:complete len:236 (-) Transcript_46455:1074-1781(-)
MTRTRDFISSSSSTTSVLSGSRWRLRLRLRLFPDDEREDFVSSIDALSLNLFENTKSGLTAPLLFEFSPLSEDESLNSVFLCSTEERFSEPVFSCVSSFSVFLISSRMTVAPASTSFLNSATLGAGDNFTSSSTRVFWLDPASSVFSPDDFRKLFLSTPSLTPFSLIVSSLFGSSERIGPVVSSDVTSIVLNFLHTVNLTISCFSSSSSWVFESGTPSKLVSSYFSSNRHDFFST